MDTEKDTKPLPGTPVSKWKSNPWKRLTRSEAVEQMSVELQEEKARIRAQRFNKSKKEKE